MSTQVHDEDVELEDKSIALLSAQRKPVKSFTFGRHKVKTFSGDCEKSYAKQLTKKSKTPKKPAPSALEGDKMVVDLIDSLPQ